MGRQRNWLRYCKPETVIDDKQKSERWANILHDWTVCLMSFYIHYNFTCPPPPPPCPAPIEFPISYVNYFKWATRSTVWYEFRVNPEILCAPSQAVAHFHTNRSTSSIAPHLSLSLYLRFAKNYVFGWGTRRRKRNYWWNHLVSRYPTSTTSTLSEYQTRYCLMLM